MNNKIKIVIVICIGLSSILGCKGPKQIEEQSVFTLENMIMESTDKRASDSLSKLLITALRKELKTETDDRKIMENMFKIGNLYYTLGDFDQAIDLCDNIVKAYPNGEITPQAIFFEATIYQFEKQMYGKANMLYDKLITQYPTSPQALEARHMVENMGMTEDELIKKFESQNAINNTVNK